MRKQHSTVLKDSAIDDEEQAFECSASSPLLSSSSLSSSSADADRRSRSMISPHSYSSSFFSFLRSIYHPLPLLFFFSLFFLCILYQFRSFSFLSPPLSHNDNDISEREFNHSITVLPITISIINDTHQKNQSISIFPSSPSPPSPPSPPPSRPTTIPIPSPQSNNTIDNISNNNNQNNTNYTANPSRSASPRTSIAPSPNTPIPPIILPPRFYPDFSESLQSGSSLSIKGANLNERSVIEFRRLQGCWSDGYWGNNGNRSFYSVSKGEVATRCPNRTKESMKYRWIPFGTPEWREYSLKTTNASFLTTPLCELSFINNPSKQDFCELIGGRSVLIVGDSLSHQFHNSFYSFFSNPDDPSVSDQYNCSSHSFCGIMKRPFRMKYIRNDYLSTINTTKHQIREHSWIHDITNYDIFIINRGAHYRSDNIFFNDYRHTLSAIRRLKPNGLLFVRNTVPGHKDCINITSPIPSIIKKNNTTGISNYERNEIKWGNIYHWNEIPQQNHQLNQIVHDNVII